MKVKMILPALIETVVIGLHHIGEAGSSNRKKLQGQPRLVAQVSGNQDRQM